MSVFLSLLSIHFTFFFSCWWLLLASLKQLFTVLSSSFLPELLSLIESLPHFSVPWNCFFMYASRDPESWYWYGNKFSAANDSYATTTMRSNAQEMSELNHACGPMSSSYLLGIRWKTRYYFVFKTFNEQKKQGKSLSQTKELECERRPCGYGRTKAFHHIINVLA